MGEGVELLISELTRSVLSYLIPHKTNGMLIFITYRLSFEYHGIYYTYKHCVQSQEIIGHIKQNSHVTSGIRDFVKCCIKSWVHLDLQPDMLLGGLQPTRYLLHAPSN